MKTSPPGPSLVREIGAAFVCRLVINTARRFAYPFAGALSRGLGIPLPAVTGLIGLNQFTGVLSLFTGPLADRVGPRRMMLAGLACLTAGMLAGGLFPVYAVLAGAMFLGGTAKSIFDPSVLAFAGERVPFHRRGMAVGVLEMGWAGASLAGIPLMGWLIARHGVRAPFLALSLAGAAGFMVLALVLPANGRTGPASAGGLGKSWKKLLRNRAALGALGFGFLINGANDALSVVYGIWLEGDFGLSVVALGGAATVIGVAELSGEGLIALLADRIGLARSVIAGTLGIVVAVAALPLLGRSLPTALAGLFWCYFCSEFGIVAALSYFTELAPGMRATMMSGYLAAASLGRMTGAMIGAPLWLAGGMTAVSVGVALASGLGLLCLLWGIHGRSAAPTTPGDESPGLYP